MRSFFCFVFFLLFFSSSLYSKEVRFVGDISYVPFEFVEKEGLAKGIFVEYWQLAAKKSNFSISYSLKAWKDALSEFDNGAYDVIGGIFYTEERAEKYLFSDPYYEISTCIFYPASMSAIVGLEDVKGFPIGVVEEDFSQEYVETNLQGAVPVLFHTSEELILGAIEGQITVFICDAPVALFWLNRYGKAVDYKHSDPIYRNYVYAAVKKDQRELLALLNSGMDQVSTTELQTIEKKWFGYQVKILLPWDTLILVISICVGSILFVFFWNFALRKKINRATSTIKDQNEKLIAQNMALQAHESQLSAMNDQLRASTEELIASLKNVEDLNQGMKEIIEVSKLLSQSAQGRGETFFEKLLKTTLRLIPAADYGSISVFEKDDWKFMYAVGHNLEQLKLLKLKKNQFIMASKPTLVDAIVDLNLSKAEARISEEKAHSISPEDPTDLRKLSQFTKPVSRSMIIGLFLGENPVGGISLDIAKASEKRFTEQDISVAEAFSNVASAFLAMQRYIINQGKFQKDLLMSMIKILEIYDPYTKGHSENVAFLSALIAENLHLPAEAVQRVYWSGLVHDVGKILVPMEILGKPEKLTDLEFLTIRKHPVWGAEVLRTSDELEDIVRNVRHHHERWDGKGYPDQLKGENIPLVSRIITVSDSFDAMTSDRPYRKRKTTRDALLEITENSGKQFDPQIAEVFEKIVLEETEFKLTPTSKEFLA